MPLTRKRAIEILDAFAPESVWREEAAERQACLELLGLLDDAGAFTGEPAPDKVTTLEKLPSQRIDELYAENTDRLARLLPGREINKYQQLEALIGAVIITMNERLGAG